MTRELLRTVDSKFLHSQEMVRRCCKLFRRITLRCGLCRGPLCELIVHQTGADRWSGAFFNVADRLCQALTLRIFARGAVALSGVFSFTPCCCELSLILVGSGFIRMLFFNSMSRGMPDPNFE